MRLIDADALYAALKDAGMLFALRMVETAPTISPTPNPPLTLDELRKMDGEPVWIFNGSDGRCSCHVIDRSYEKSVFFTDNLALATAFYGRAWTAYRCKPEEGK